MKIALYVSNHGFGHASRMAALAKAFTTFMIEIVICTDRPKYLFDDLPQDLVSYRTISIDKGVIHKENLVVDIDATKDALFELFSRRELIVAEEADFLRREKIDLVISDIPYFIIESCGYAEIPIFGVSNFDWSYIYDSLFGMDQDTQPLINVIRSLYRRMDGSYLLNMGYLESVPGFRNPKKGGMLARTLSEPINIRAKYDIEKSQKILLISFGGEGILELNLEMICAAWDGVVLCSYPSPDISNLIKISPDEDYLSVIYEADLILCKPGYSTFAEILSMGKPMIYIPRNNYPEEKVLIEGIKDYPAAIQIDRIPDNIDEIKALFNKVHNADNKLPVSNDKLAGCILSDYLKIRYPEDKLISIYDLGSNNMNYLLYNKTRDIVIHRAWCTTGLGRDFANDRLSDRSIQRAFMVISKIMNFDNEISSQKELIATGINRKALNKDLLLDMVKDRWQINTKIISATREMRLSWLASERIGTDVKQKLVIDIGGASTEVSYLDNNKLSGKSFDFGLQSLIRDFSSIDQALISVQNAFSELPEIPNPNLIAVGLTATILARTLLGIPYKDILRKDFLTINIDQIDSFLRAVELNQFHNYEDLFEDRYEQDSIYLAACIIKLLLDRYRCYNFMVCNDGISMGYAKWKK
nr:hypothetical protein [Candidatus Cloacimonadota bacterium]